MNSQRIEILFRNLQKDPRSVFYSIRTLSESMIKKAHRLFYEKDVVFVNLYKELEDKNFYQKKEFYLLLLCFLIKKAILTTQLYIVLVNLLIMYMGILLIQDFWLSLQLIQNIVFYWLIYLLLKFTFIR